MAKLALYEATVNLPGLRAGEQAEIDPDSIEYLRRWIAGGYLVPVKRQKRRR